jgi:predicted O-methyltransferase YrrM
LNIFGKIISKLQLSTISIILLGKEISRLQNEDDEVLKLLANIFSDVIKNRYSKSENGWIGKIEKLRNSLNISSDKISVTDYGAGSPDSRLSKSDMYQGRSDVMTIGEVCRTASKPYKWDFLLFKLVREFRPSVCLELGTAMGISAAYIGAACELNNNGHVVTLEGAESLVSLANATFEKLNISRVNVISGRFQDTLQEVLDKYSPIDFVFIDGHHDEDATISYFIQIFPRLSDGALLVFDDISWSKGMKRAWKTIKSYRNIKVSVDLVMVGLCIFTKSPVESNKHFRIAI